MPVRWVTQISLPTKELSIDLSCKLSIVTDVFIISRFLVFVFIYCIM